MKERNYPCAYCEGKGKDPFGVPSSESTCQVCAGKGTHLLVGKESGIKECHYCDGSGKHSIERLTCPVCRGHGVFQFDGEGSPCSECHGNGKCEDGYFPCAHCQGYGVIRKSP